MPKFKSSRGGVKSTREMKNKEKMDNRAHKFERSKHRMLNTNIDHGAEGD